MISIIGAGIAGLATAITLKSKGISVQIFERTASCSDIGAGIVLWPNAMFVLKQMGLFEQITARSFPLRNMQRYDQNNQSLGALPITTINQQTGLQSRSILRSNLLDLLLAHAQSLNIPLFFNHQLERINQTDSAIQLFFQDNITHTTHAVIGADGRMNSKVRLYLKENNQPIFQNFINVLGVATFSTQNAQACVLDYWGVGERFGIVPVSQERAYWAAGWHCTEKTGLDKKTGKALIALLNTKFSQWPTQVQRLLKALDPNAIKALYIHDHEPCQNWSKGNVLMLGDAAHAALPTSGQGACQALEDAWWLAKIIDEQNVNAAAFARFSEQRSAKTANVIQTGRALARSIFNTDVHYCEQRNQQSKAANFEQSATAMAQFWMQDLVASNR